METDVRDGILRDLARVRAMWMGDIRDLWCGGDKVRCTRVVQDLVDRKLVEVRRGCSDARRRYVVLTATGAEAADMDKKRRGSRVNAAAGERLADRGTLFAEFVRSGVGREGILVGQELRHRTCLPRLSRPMVGLQWGPRLIVVVRAPLSWERWRRLLGHASGISEWVFLAKDNRTWSRQLNAWVAGGCQIPSWIPRPTWSIGQLLQALNDRGSAAREVAREACRQGLDLVLVSEDQADEADQSWCYVEGRLCLLEDLRGWPVHRLCALASMPHAAERDCRCVVVETARDATRVAKYVDPGAPWYFLVGSGGQVQLVRLQGGGLIPVAGAGR